MPEHFILHRDHFQALLDALRDHSYRVIGPTIRDGAIVYEDLNSTSDLPIGWTDEQEGGTYRLKKRDDAALFGYVIGPHSWKKFLHPPMVRLWQVSRSFQVEEEKPAKERLAFVGVRACELHAIAIQDKVLLGGTVVDSNYQGRRENIFVIAVNCGQAGNTCFCVSMNAGPKAVSGFDLALTEILKNNEHYFVGEVGTTLGGEILGEIPHDVAEKQQEEQAQKLHENTARQMGRRMDTEAIRELLYANYENARWDDVAARCLTCGNCTMVCPTCFCTTVVDVTDLKGEHAERWQEWDSCFSLDFSYIHGGSVRTSTKARYRQWMTHKLATWIDQFGSSGCVGCGRCITWCPVGIDITVEARAIRESDLRVKDSGRKTNGDT